MTSLKAIGAYILTFFIFFAFLWWFFDNPREHEVLISVLTAFFASSVAGGIIEDAILDEREKLVNALITAGVTSGIWLYGFYDDYSQRVEKFADHQFLSAVGSVINAWDFLLIAAVTFITIIARVKKS